MTIKKLFFFGLKEDSLKINKNRIKNNNKGEILGSMKYYK